VQCIPYRNRDSAPYPFNTAEDPFLADHACCNNDFTIANTNTICNIEPNPNNYTCINSTLILTDKAKITHCDGKRGNACLGKTIIVSDYAFIAKYDLKEKCQK